MRLHSLAALFALIASVNAHQAHQVRHVHRRQALLTTTSTTPSGAATSPSINNPTATGSTNTGARGTGPTTATGARTASTGLTTGTATTTSPTTTGPPPLATGTGIPPLSGLTSGMPTRATTPVTATFPPGALPPVDGAPPLPTQFVFRPGDWPTQDIVPPTDSPEVAEWLKELDGFVIPDIRPTINGSCTLDPGAADQAANNGWWTCGGYTRDTDITACPDPFTWGVSFDDGPSKYTQYLLNYLTQSNLLATFFVVGSRVIERSNVLIEEYMAGHEISVHTWSHHPLTSLTTEQVVAELGWTRKAIKDVLGVTPTTMRPPYGDIDDRVRAISLAMGLVPILWTRPPTPPGVKSTYQFDTNDWKVAGGIVTGIDSFNTFQAILGNASELSTGFIVLQHDLFEVTVDLAVGFTLNAAQTHNPPFTLKPIGQCSKIPTSNLYVESNQNTTFPPPHKSGACAGSSSHWLLTMLAAVLAFGGFFLA